MSSIRLNIHRARGIRSVTSYGQQDPYVRVVLKPAPEGGAEAEVRSKVAAGGGVSFGRLRLVRKEAEEVLLPVNSDLGHPLLLLRIPANPAVLGRRLLGRLRRGGCRRSGGRGSIPPQESRLDEMPGRSFRRQRLRRSARGFGRARSAAAEAGCRASRNAAARLPPLGIAARGVRQGRAPHGVGPPPVPGGRRRGARPSKRSARMRRSTKGAAAPPAPSSNARAYSG